jgi:hypothetical protein
MVSFNQLEKVSRVYYIACKHSQAIAAHFMGALEERPPSTPLEGETRVAGAKPTLFGTRPEGPIMSIIV